eukprot:355635-Chlamydomonas_euryale.AAC.6
MSQLAVQICQGQVHRDGPASGPGVGSVAASGCDHGQCAHAFLPDTGAVATGMQPGLGAGQPTHTWAFGRMAGPALHGRPPLGHQCAVAPLLQSPGCTRFNGWLSRAWPPPPPPHSTPAPYSLIQPQCMAAPHLSGRLAHFNSPSAHKLPLASAASPFVRRPLRSRRTRALWGVCGVCHRRPARGRGRRVRRIRRIEPASVQSRSGLGGSIGSIGKGREAGAGERGKDVRQC